MSEQDNQGYVDEEYHFADEPDMQADSSSAEKISEPVKDVSPKPVFPFEVEKVKAFFNENSPARNAVVVVGILLTLFIVYQIISGLFFQSKNAVVVPKTVIKQSPIQTVTRPVAQPIATPNEFTLGNQMPGMKDINEFKSRLSAMEQNQTNAQDQVMSINNQLASINTNLDMLTSKLTQLSQQLTQLNSVVNEQAQQLTLLKAHLEAKPKLVKRIIPRGPSMVYYLKAVIPGRAWLVTNNGNTMTVRVGTPIAGYGVVRFIDAIQGRVLTSSGHLIKFSQEDS